MPNEERIDVVMVLYVSDDSPASDRAWRNVTVAAHRLGVDKNAWAVRNASREDLTDTERADAVITPVLMLPAARRPIRITRELDDVDALEQSLRSILQTRRQM